jgi:hypothetical protein
MPRVLPGDWAVINTGSRSTPLVEFGQMLAGGHETKWDHVVIASRHDPQQGLMIVEAMPSGSREVPWHYASRPHVWSTGLFRSCPPAGAMAQKLAGRPYSWADYAEIGLHRRFHLDTGWLQRRIADSGHLICSQLVDLAWQMASVQLWDDKRWNGDVMPADFGRLIGV